MKIIDLEKRQGDFQMKTGSFSMEEGKIHGIIGGNGCGKTTLMNMLSGIYFPDSGRIGGLNPDLQLDKPGPHLSHNVQLFIIIRSADISK